MNNQQVQRRIGAENGLGSNSMTRNMNMNSCREMLSPLFSIKRLQSAKTQLLLPLCLAGLVGCGESGLEAIQDDAIVAAQDLQIAAAESEQPGVEDIQQPIDSSVQDTTAPPAATAPETAEPDTTDPDTAEPGTTEPDTTTETAEINTIDLSGFQLVFNENFDESELNADKWNTAFKWGPELTVNNEQQYYVDTQNQTDFGYNPFRVDGGNLFISASPTPVELTEAANNQPYLSGVLTSADKFNFSHGSAEIRAQIPSGAGLWPQFWLLPHEFIGLKPQLYVMEAKGGSPSAVYHNYKWQDDNNDLQTSPVYKTEGGDFSADFHTYGVEWNPGELIFYVDGIEQHRFASDNVSDQQMYLIVNLAVGGWFSGEVDESTVFPAELTIDHIRVFQRIN